METIKNFFVGMNNFLAKLRTKTSILETTTIQKFNEVNTWLDTLQAMIETSLGLLECTVKDSRSPTSESGPLRLPSKKACTSSLGPLGVVKPKSK